MAAVAVRVPTASLVGPFAERLLVEDLPDLASDRRAAAVAFVVHRVERLPDFTRLGVVVIAAAVRLVMTLPSGWAIARRLTSLPLPLVGEYPRLVRSLAWAFVWEHWPSTGPTGAAP